MTSKFLFSSGFKKGVNLGAPSGGRWQTLSGTDNGTGYSWPPNVRGDGAALQLLTRVGVDDTTVSNYIVNQMQTVVGDDGAPTQALFQNIVQQ
jgi:hypothetical protein